MEDTTKYGTSTVLLTSVSDAEEKPKELEGFPCISPMDDGNNSVCIDFVLDNISAGICLRSDDCFVLTTERANFGSLMGKSSYKIFIAFQQLSICDKYSLCNAKLFFREVG